MDQFISKPLKRFLYNSKEIATKRKNNLNAVQYSAGSDKAVIKMAEIKSIMRMNPKILETNLDNIPPTTKQVTKNNVLFSDSIETINSDGSHNFDSISDNEVFSDNNNSTQLVKVKLLTEPVKETATVLNLNPANRSHESNGLLQDDSEVKDGDNFARQSVIKIKVKVLNKNNLESNDNRSEETNTETIENELHKNNSTFDSIFATKSKTETIENESHELNNSIASNKKSNKNNSTVDSIFAAQLIEELQNIDKPTENNYPSKTTEACRVETIDDTPIPPAKSIEEFQNIPETDKHNVGESCIFAENKTRPLSPIPVIPPQISPKTNPFRTVDNLIDFHERQVHKTGRSPPKTLPRMGTSALFNRSPSKNKLNDSEIISELVRDRFIVNMYESRSYRRSFVKKPSTYGRIYKSLERTANYYYNNDLLNSDIVTIKQSSPIKLKDQVVSLQATPVRQPLQLEQTQNQTEEPQTDNIDQVCHDIENILISQETTNESSETLYEEDFPKTPSSEYGTGSNLTISLEQQLQQISESQCEQTFGSEVSSYNMEDFLKKALGDELNNLDNTEVSPPQEPSITTSNASALISKLNTFQSTLYRSFTRRLQGVSTTLRPPSHPQDKHSVHSHLDSLDSLFSNNQEVAALLRQAAVQYEAIRQISKALVVCGSTKEFCGSSEQVEGERLLLVATHKRQSILSEIRRLEYTPTIPSPSPSPTPGSLTITHITVPLSPPPPSQDRPHNLTKWYVVLLSCGLQVAASRPTPAARDGSVRFGEEVVFKELPTEFEVEVGVYCMTERKARVWSHESKYRINKDTKRSRCPTPKKLLSREKSQKIPTRSDTGIRTSSFKLCGSLKLTVADLTQPGPWNLRGKIPLCSALQGTVSFTLKSSVRIPVKHSGFLTVGSESGGYASWNRRWCVLDGHVIRYWNYPSEEEAAPLKELDLKCCVSSKVQSAERSICARPRTLLVEIARRAKPDDSNSSFTVERYYLSADTLADLNVWQEELDRVVQALRIWNFGFLS